MGFTIFFKRPFEKHERRFIERFLSSGSVQTFVDVGANQGLYTLIAARHMPGGQVIAFEPLIAEAAKLRGNLAVNRYGNVRVEEKALGALEGDADMFMCLGEMSVFQVYVLPRRMCLWIRCW